MTELPADASALHAESGAGTPPSPQPERPRRRISGVAIDSGWATAGLGLMTATGLAANVVITRTLPPGQVGIYFVCVSLVAVLAVVARAGLDFGVVRFVGAGIAHDETGVARGSLALALKLVTVFAGVLGALLVVSWTPWLSNVATGTRVTLSVGLLVGFILLADSVRLVASEAFRGFGDIARASAYGNAMQGVLFLAILITAKITLPHVTLTRCLQAALLASAITCFWAVRSIVRRMHVLGPATAVPPARMLGQSVPMMLTSLSGLLLSQGAVLVAGGLISPDSAALYGAALRVALLLEAPLFIANAVILPMIVRLHATRQSAELERTLRTSATIVSVANLAALAFLVVAGEVLMRVLFGSFFVSAAPLVAILAAAQLVSALAGSCGITLSMTGNERAAMFIALISAVGAIALELILGELFGVNGVAMGAAFGIGLANVIGAIVVKNRLGILSIASFGIAWRWVTHVAGGRNARA